MDPKNEVEEEFVDLEPDADLFGIDDLIGFEMPRIEESSE